MVKISADTTSLTNGLTGAGKSMGGFSAQTVEKSQAVATGVMVAGAAIIGFGVACIKMYSDAQTVTLALNNLTGSSAKTTTMVAGLATAFKGSTFSTAALDNSAEVLLKLGFNAQQVVPIMKDVGNAVASVGGGTTQMDAVDAILGKINTTGKVTAKQLTSMGTDGVDAMGILEAKFNETGPQLTKSISSGAITTAQVMSSLTSGMATKYGGDMQKAANTINGQLTIIKNQATDVMVKIGGILSTSLPIKGFLTAVASIGASFEAIVDKSKTLGQLFNNLFSTKDQIILVALAGVITAMMIPAMTVWALKTAIGVIENLEFILSILPMILIFAAIAVAALLIIKYWSTMGSFFTNIWNVIKAVTISSWDAIKNFFAITIPAIITAMLALIGILPGRISSYFSQVYNSVSTWLATTYTRAVSLATSLLNGMSNIIATLPGRIGSYFSSAYSQVSNWMSNIYNRAVSMAGSLVSGIASSIAGIPGDFSRIGSDILSYISNLAGSLLSAGERMGANLWSGFVKAFHGSPRTKIEDDFINIQNQANKTLGNLSGLAPQYNNALGTISAPMTKVLQPLTTSTAPITAKATIASSNNQATSAQGQSIVNQFNIPSLTVRSAADIKAIAQQLFRLQQSQYRSQGGTI